MSIYAEAYMHESDYTYLKALKAIPGFTPLLKAFIQFFNESDLRVANMGTNLRLGKDQLPKYYNMLLPICEKLGIDVPELYLELNAQPNAYTYGDTNPFIVITSGMLETMPEELIKTVLAHECGHIACHHVLYHTMGQMIFSEAVNASVFGDLLSRPLKAALGRWMRSSELSADRAATICDGTADKMIEVCLRLSGFDKDIGESVNVSAYMQQVEEYKKLVKDTKWNRILQSLLLEEEKDDDGKMKVVNTHPANVIRAHECSQWQQSEQFRKIVCFLDHASEIRELPITYTMKDADGKNAEEVKAEFEKYGFKRVELQRVTEAKGFIKAGQVLHVTIGAWKDFKAGDWFREDEKVVVEYYQPLNTAEIAAMHPGEIQMPETSKSYAGKHYKKAVEQLTRAGFTNIEVREFKSAKKGWLDNDGDVFRITADGESKFDKGAWYKPDVKILIDYAIFVQA